MSCCIRAGGPWSGAGANQRHHSPAHSLAHPFAGHQLSTAGRTERQLRRCRVWVWGFRNWLRSRRDRLWSPCYRLQRSPCTDWLRWFPCNANWLRSPCYRLRSPGSTSELRRPGFLCGRPATGRPLCGTAAGVCGTAPGHRLRSRAGCNGEWRLSESAPRITGGPLPFQSCAKCVCLLSLPLGLRVCPGWGPRGL